MKIQKKAYIKPQIVVHGDTTVLEQVRKQLQKLVPVVKVVDYLHKAHVERDLMLVQVSTSGGEAKSERGEITDLANLFRGRIVDVSPDQLMIELSGTEEKLEAFVELIRPYGVVELALFVIDVSKNHVGDVVSFRHAERMGE